MPTIYLVRHGKAAAGFGSHPDPGLNELGQAQAQATARTLAELARPGSGQAPLPIYSSPLARAQQTAQPLCKLWNCDYTIEPRVAEIPSPTEDLSQRSAWLQGIMAGTWDALDTSLQQWRTNLAQCLLDLKESSVLFSHYVAINAAVGVAQSDNRMVVFRPDNASVTTLSNDNGKLRVLELGGEAVTFVN